MKYFYRMNALYKTLVPLALYAVTWQALAQGFASGSNGSYGPINVTATTVLDVPPDGIFHCTSITIASSRVLSFRRNALNTPVYLLATGDVKIDGTIDVSGKQGSNVAGGEGGPGGFDGGNPGSVSTPPGAGYGPGAGSGGAAANNNSPGAAGAAAFATPANTASTNRGATYGSALLIPIIGGSGGGGAAGTPGVGGGGGGGAIVIASNTRIDLSGAINANGEGNPAGLPSGGSGGAVRLIAPIIAGNGIVRVIGSHSGGNGRIRVDTLNRSSLNFNLVPPGVASLGSMMLVFPTPNPRLDIIEAAGTAVPLNSGPVFVQLPFGSSPNRVIKLQARDFNDVVPITVQLTPDNGTPIRYETQIDNRGNIPATTDVNVVLPVNVQVAVHAWTR
jgi:hypothetical protein